MVLASFSGISDGSGIFGDDVADAVLDENDEPSALAYCEACASLKAIRCSQWQRACLSQAPEVSLNHYGLGKVGAEALALSLKKNSHVQGLDLSDNGLGPEGTTSILKALTVKGGAPSVRLLTLRQNKCGQDGAEAIRELLRSQHPLESLDVAANELCTKGAQTIAESLGSNTSLTSLCLEHNELESEAVDALAKALGTNRSLTTLSLEWNTIGPPGAQSLADLLHQGGSSLVTLNLGWNGLGDSGVRCLAQAIEQQPADGALRDVRLHHNRMTADAAVPLAKCLRVLDVLDVSGNALGASGAAVLLLAQQDLRKRAADATGGDGEGHHCQLMMEDVCVRPDTALAGLVMRAAAGEEIIAGELQAGGVHAAAAIAKKAVGVAAEPKNASRNTMVKKAEPPAAAGGAKPKAKGVKGKTKK